MSKTRLRTQCPKLPTSRAARKPDRLFVTRRDLAELLGVRMQSVTRLTAEGMPIASSGGGRGRPALFDAAAALQWVREREQADVPGAAQSIRDEYLAALRDRVLQDTAARAGELVSRQVVIDTGKSYTFTWRGMLLSLPRRAVQAGVPKQYEAELAKLVRQVLDEISRWKVPADAEKARKKKS